MPGAVGVLRGGGEGEYEAKNGRKSQRQRPKAPSGAASCAIQHGFLPFMCWCFPVGMLDHENTEIGFDQQFNPINAALATGVAPGPAFFFSAEVSPQLDRHQGRGRAVIFGISQWIAGEWDQVADAMQQ